MSSIALRRWNQAQHRRTTTPPPPAEYGAVVPTTDLPGWKLLMTDDFNRTSLDGAGMPNIWNTYGPSQSSAYPGRSWWMPSHVVLPGNSTVQLLGYVDPAASSGGVDRTNIVSTGAISMSYGVDGKGADYTSFPSEYRMEVRFRHTADSTDSTARITKHAFMVYPSSSTEWPWPTGGEIDWSENFDPTRQDDQANYHGYNPSTSSNFSISSTSGSHDLKHDLTQWTVLGVEKIGNDVLNYICNGDIWYTMNDSRIIDNIPGKLILQQEGMTNTVPTGSAIGASASTPSIIEIDWVAIYVPDTYTNLPTGYPFQY